MRLAALVIFSATLFAQSKEPLVEFDRMTWPEVKQALQSGKTTALVYNGGTEQRGPQNVTGGHTLIARETGRRIALKLGTAILAPVLPYSPNNASADLLRHHRTHPPNCLPSSTSRLPSNSSSPGSRTSS